MAERQTIQRATPYARPVVTRSRLMLETASELVAGEDWPDKQIRVQFRVQGTAKWSLNFFASDSPEGISEVGDKTADFAIINPAAPATLAFRGQGPFKRPLPLRAITVIPSLDRIGFAVSKHTGLTSLLAIREKRYPLRVSMRGHLTHSVHLFIREVLAAAGFTLEEIGQWGGEVRYDDRVANGPKRMEALATGRIDAIFDEALSTWGNEALNSGMRFLPLDDSLLEKLEAMGFRRAAVTRMQCSKLDQEVTTLDFSGWMVFTRADVSDEVVRAFCHALEMRKERIPWQGEGPLPLDSMCRDTPQGPLEIPLHPAAAHYWRERCYLT
jgi:TRAP-type uncharacterized transport system substrate-binding protein